MITPQFDSCATSGAFVGKPYFYKYKMIKRILYTLLIMFPVVASAQINTDRVMAIGRNALYFEDYVLSIQYFNQVINAKPYLSDPYFIEVWRR